MNKDELFEVMKGIGAFDRPLWDMFLLRDGLGLPYFTLNTSLKYGEDFLDCRLYIRHGNEGETDSYHLEKYEATLRTSLIWQYPVVNRINTQQLDQRLHNINLGEVLYYPETTLLHSVNSVMTDLWRLSENNSEEGKAIQAYLLSKYFPISEIGLQPYLDSLPAKWKPSMTVSDFSGEFPNVHLCYSMLYGNKIHLENQLQNIGLDPGIALDRMLSLNNDSFTLAEYKLLEEGIMCYKIPFVKQRASQYTVQDYTARLCPFPIIEHISYKGVDTQELEQRMRKIDWSDEASHYVMLDSEPRFHQQIEQIISDLHYILPDDEPGARISSQLQLKYWLESPDFFNVVDNSAWDYYNQLPARETSFPVSLHSEAAYNLLCGRAAHISEDTWMKLDLTLRTEKGYLAQDINGLLPVSIPLLLAANNIDSDQIPAVTESLLKGSKVLTNYQGGGPIWVEPFAEKQTLTFISPDRMLKYTAMGPGLTGRLVGAAPGSKKESDPTPEYYTKRKNKSGKRRRH